MKATQAETGLTFTFQRYDPHTRCLLYCEGFHVSVQWNLSIANSLHGDCLTVMLWRGHAVMQDGTYYGQPEHLSETKLQFDGGPDDSPRWRRNAKESYSTTDCADFIVRLLIDQVRRVRLSPGDGRFTMIVLPSRSPWN